MSTTSWPRSTSGRSDRGVAEPAQPAHRRVGDRGEPQQLADAALQPQVPHRGRAPRPRTRRPPRTRAVRPASRRRTRTRGGAALPPPIPGGRRPAMASRRTPAVVTPRASATPPRNPAHQSSSGSRGRRAAPPGAERTRPFRAGSAARPRLPGSARPRTRPSVPARADTDADEVGCAEVRPSAASDGEGAWERSERPRSGDACPAATRRGGEQVVGAAERLELQALGREGVVDPALVHLQPPRRVGADEAVQVPWPVRGRVGPRSGSEPGPSRTSPRRSRRRRPARHHPGATCRHPGAVRKRWSPLATSVVPSARRDPVGGLARRPVREHLRGHVPAGSVGVHRGAHHGVAGPQLGDRAGAAVGEQHAGRPVEAVDAGVPAAAVRVHGPAEGHRRVARDAVQRRLRLDLVERHSGELRHAYGAQEAAQTRKGQLGADAVVQDLLPAPSHGVYSNTCSNRWQGRPAA